MKMHHAVTFLMMLSAANTQAASYNFTTIDVPGSTDTLAYGINGTGEIVGTFFEGIHPNIALGFLRNNDGSFTTISVPGSKFTN